MSLKNEDYKEQLVESILRGERYFFFCVVDMTSIQIIFHKKLNAIQCFCGFTGINHQCQKTIQGKVIFCSCSEEECSKCQDKIKRDKYNEERWSTDRDCYLVCGTCYEKISDEICTNCFCRICYAALEEYCECQRDD